MTSTNKGLVTTISEISLRCFSVCNIKPALLAALLLLFGAPISAQNLDWANHPLVQPPFYGGNDDGKAIATDASGNVYVTGYYINISDFDPGAGTANLTSAGSSDVFIAKYDASGNYLWAKSVGGTGADAGYGIALDGSGNIYLTGSFNSTADFDPGAGTANLISTGGSDIFIAKYDVSGNYLWAKGMGSADTDTGYGIAVDGSGNAHITGYFQNTVDFDPGAGTTNLTSAGSVDIFIAKYDASGNYQWAKRMGGPNSDVGYGLAVDGSGNVHATGYFANTVDFDPGAGTANLTNAGVVDIFIAKYDASGNYIWAKNMGGTSFDEGRSIALDGSGNVHITGYFWNTADFDPGAGTANRTSAGEGDIFIAKYSSAGNFLWANHMGGINSEAGHGLALDGSGNVHVTGFFSNTVDFDPSAGTANLTSTGGNSNDVFIAKYNASGNYTWAQNVGSANLDIGYGIAVSGSGNVHVTGNFEGTGDFDPGAGVANLSPGTNTSDAFALRLSSAGNYNWAINWGRYSVQPSSMECHAIARDASGNVYATGYFNGENVDFDPGPGTANQTSDLADQNIFIAKYDASGNFLWAKSLVGNSTAWGEGIAVDGNGNVYLTGFFYGTVDFDPGIGTANRSSLGSNDIFIAKYDASGNYIWAKSMGGTSFDISNDIALDGSGNAYLTGYFGETVDFDPSAGTANLTSTGGSDLFIAKYDASGNYIWAKRVGGTGNDSGNSIALDGGGNVYLTGYFGETVDFDPSAGTANLTSTGGSDLFIAKYDASGNYIWAKGMGGTDIDSGNDLALDGSGNVHITGFFQETADFDPGAGTANLISAGDYDMFIAKYNASGNYIWAKRVGGAGNDSSTGLDLDGSGNVYITGSFQQTADFDPGAGTANLTSAGFSDVFIAQYDASGNYLSAMRAGSTGYESGLCIAAASAYIINVGGFFSETVDFDPGAGTTNHTAIAATGDLFIAQYNYGAAGFTDCPSAPIEANTDPGQCSAVVNYTVAASGAPMTYAFSDATVANGNGTGSGSAFNTGLTTVTVTAAGATCVFTVTVLDDEAPVAACPAPANVNCSGNVPAPNTASVGGMDNCGIVSKVHLYTSAPYDVTCINGFKVSRFYRVFDAAGNSASCSQVITVDDKIQPTFTFVPANVTVQCNSVPAVGSPTASDNCGGAVSITYNGQTTVAGACPDAYTLTRKWTATDACGNIKTATQRITVIDTQKPNFTSTPFNVTVQCDAVPAVAMPTATDNCDTAVAVTYNGQTTTPGACTNAYTLTRRWTAADNCGNTRSISQIIAVVDNGKPVFTSFPANTNIACNENPPAVGNPTASDACGSATVTYIGQSTAAGTCSGSYQIRRTWRATDACGNSTAATQTIYVQDTNEPVFTSTPGPISIECGDPLPPLVNPTASDACGGYVQITFLGHVATGSGCSADYTVTRTWRADDLCGNTATTTQVITVLGSSYGEEGSENRMQHAGHPQESPLRVHPNPTTDRIWVDLSAFADQAVTVSIFSDLGQLVWENRIPAVEELKLQVSLLEAGAKAGVYTISVRSASGVAAKRVVLVE